VYKITFYVPETHLEQVKQALFAVGVGKINNYDCCCWQVLGQGQFRPLADSQPFLGEQNKVETLSEYKVETVCASELIQAAVLTLKKVHPYEEPAYEVYQLADF